MRYLIKGIKKCSNIAGFFNHSTNLKENLYKEQTKNNMPQKSLIQQVKTRWNSLYFMVSRILVNITSLNPLLINETKNKNDIIDQSERKMLEDACSVLQNFHEVTKLFSGENYVTSDVIIPSFLKLKQITNVDDNMSDEFINLFKKILNIEIEIYCL